MFTYLKKIFLITTLMVGYFEAIEAAAVTVANPEVDIMSSPGIFRNINMAKASDFCTTLATIPEFNTQPVKRFFDLLGSTVSPELSRRQMAYHLTTLVALGPKVNEVLLEGDYSWVLDSDRSTSDHAPDLVYDFFGQVGHTGLRQTLWSVMRSSEFVESELPDITDPFYYRSGGTLRTLLDETPEPIDIIIGGNSIPTYYTVADPKRAGDYGNIFNTAFGSSSYRRSYQERCITIGVDHRHRPRVLANAYDPILWRDLTWEKVRSIRYDYLSLDRLRLAIPEEMHGMIVPLNENA